MTREEKESLLREAVDILIKLDNHLMTTRDNAEFSQWVEELIENYCEEREQGNILFMQVKEHGSMGYIVGYALVGAFLIGVLVGFGVSRFIDKE